MVDINLTDREREYFRVIDEWFLRLASRFPRPSSSVPSLTIKDYKKNSNGSLLFLNKSEHGKRLSNLDSLMGYIPSIIKTKVIKPSTTHIQFSLKQSISPNRFLSRHPQGFGQYYELAKALKGYSAETEQHVEYMKWVIQTHFINLYDKHFKNPFMKPTKRNFLFEGTNFNFIFVYELCEYPSKIYT